MPIFKYFAENGNLLHETEEPLNANNIEKYIKENGAEKVEGYLEAIEDFTTLLNRILFTKKGKFETENSMYSIKHETKKYYLENLSFLEVAKNFIKEYGKTGEEPKARL